MRSIILVFLSLICYSQTYKILVCYPLALRSLNILGEGIVRHLLNDGHEVTFITIYPVKNPAKNLRQIDISGVIDEFYQDETFSIGYVFENNIQEENIYHSQELAKDNGKRIFQNENMTKFLEDPNEHFDVVIVDLFETELYAGLSVLYDCPMIWMYSMGAHWQVVRLISDTANPAYDADFYLPYILPPFTFTQRVTELWTRIVWSFYKSYFTLPKEQEIYKETFGPLVSKRGRVLPDYEDVIFNTSIMFGNEHNAIAHRPATPQNFKYIGGFHIEESVKPLPKDLQDLLDNNENGVIYFSMGSFWRSKDLPMKLIGAILDVFCELKQTVIWKYEDVLEDIPKNVKIVRWAPQQSILAHPNCKFFITHGGLLSSIESVHFGVPIIGIPVLCDQYSNTMKAVTHGYGIKVDLNWDLPKNLKAAINEMLHNDIYRKKVKELSFIYHDRPVKPSQELTHWVNHVMRTRGAPHLRSPAINVPLYQRLYLDLAALIVGIIFLLYLSLKTSNKNIVKKKKQ